ncbi:hypothetical protein ACFL6U_21530 [Planctomycetota bacterium]
MKNPVAKLAVAAAVVVVVLIGLNEMGGSGTSVAWGKVVQNVEASPGFTYRMKQIHKRQGTETKVFHMTAYGSAQYGMRMDGYLDPEYPIQTYGSLKEKAVTSISHSSKTYTRMPLVGDQLAELEELDPKKHIAKYLSAEYRKLGRKIIEGIEAEGIEIDDLSFSKANFKVDRCVVQLWIAVDTDLPILVEVDTVGKDGTLEIHTVQDNFQWNIELDANMFEPNIPEDYTLLEAELDADGRTLFKTTEEDDSQAAAGAKIRMWRFRDKHPKQGYRLVSKDGQATTNIPLSWADSPEHAVRIQEELDLLTQQDNRDLLEVKEIWANGQLDFRILRYEYAISDGQKIKIPDFDPSDPSQWTVIGKRQTELSRLLRERRKQEETGQDIATTEERQVNGRLFTFKKRRFVLSDGTEIIHFTGQPKND